MFLCIVELSWQIERRRMVVNIFQNWDNDICPSETLTDVLDMLKELSNDPVPVSTTHHHFQLNVCKFGTLLTGKISQNYPDALQALRDFGGQRTQQWKLIYAEVEKLSAEIACHKQIIACLEYRHVLESLPNKDAIKRKFSLTKAPQAATPAWQYTWKLAVEACIESMLQDYFVTKPPPTASTAAPLPATGAKTTTVPATLPPAAPAPTASGPTASAHPSHLLKQLLQNDFDYWAKTNKPSLNAMAGTPNVASVAYADWPPYQRGRGLFNELSGNIHKYGKTYDLRDGDWLRSDGLILRWLKPDVDAGTGEVKWDDEWKNRRLPP